MSWWPCQRTYSSGLSRFATTLIRGLEMVCWFGKRLINARLGWLRGVQMKASNRLTEEVCIPETGTFRLGQVVIVLVCDSTLVFQRNFMA